METPKIYVVVRPAGYDKDEYVIAYLTRAQAVEHATRLNGGEAYDEDGVTDYRVWSIPLGGDQPVILAELAEIRQKLEMVYYGLNDQQGCAYNSSY